MGAAAGATVATSAVAENPAVSTGEATVELLGAVRDRVEGNVVHLRLRTSAGDISARYHPVPDATAAAVWVGGAGGGLDGPAGGLYPAACEQLQPNGIAGLRVDYRFPNELTNCTLDTLIAVEFLRTEGIERVALIGHSFGGAVVISAGARSNLVKAVIPMSTQSYGTDDARRIAPRSLLLIHGTEDEILSDRCSQQVFDRARQPKELKLYPGARHGLDSAREEILRLLTLWIPAKLKP